MENIPVSKEEKNKPEKKNKNIIESIDPQTK
jgi:hypothetical protein